MSKIYRALLVAGVLPLLADCGRVSTPENSQTHWLKQCNNDADCDTLSCICNYCVEPCNADGTCTSEGTTCIEAQSTQVASTLCGGAPIEHNVCLANCSDSKPCGEAEACVEGSCVPASVFPDAAPDSEWGQGSPLMGATSSKQLDLLFVVDNSISMADKQQVLKLAVPDLVNQLVGRGVDMRIGVISSSLGAGVGDTALCPSNTEQKDDKAHLVATLPRAADLGITDGYLSWMPGQDAAGFTAKLQDLIVRVGEQGCGYEAQLESWYRFLVDPAPPAEWQLMPCSADNSNLCAEPSGIDNTLLEQRNAFLRPGSALAIVMLTDEDDCSMDMKDQGYYMGRSDITLWGASSVCASNPNDPCCYSCGEGSPPDGCAEDPNCAVNRFLPRDEDAFNLRCFDQKRRFGTSFLYPTERYLAGLTNRQVATWNGDFAQNPLYPSVPDARGPSLVFLAGIVGVPWQDLAADDTPTADLRFLSAPELNAAGRWNVILGSPAASPPVPPSDPLMIQSVEPRAGTTFDGESLQSPTAGYMANAVNGHEWNAQIENDLQYACIFPLPMPRDCNAVVDPNTGCDCKQEYLDRGDNNPLCQDPSGAYTATQNFAKAFPGTRELQLLKAVGNQAIVGSVCTRNVNDQSAADFGYRPVVNGLFERLAPVLH